MSDTTDRRLCARCSDPIEDDDEVVHAAGCIEPEAVTAGAAAEPLAMYLAATTTTVMREQDATFRNVGVYVAAQRLVAAVEDKLLAVGRPDGLHDEVES